MIGPYAHKDAARIAYHEAGHAVVALLVGIGVDGAQIGLEGQADKKAFVRIRTPSWYLQAIPGTTLLTPVQRAYTAASIKHKMAGWLAEREYVNGAVPMYDLAHTIDGEAIRQAQRMIGVRDWRHWSPALWAATETLIDENWYRIDAVA